MIPDWPWWAWALAGHLTGLGGGFAIATGVGIGRAMETDTLHVLADMQQRSDEEGQVNP